MGPYINCLQEFYRYFIGKSGLRISNLWGLHVTYNPSKNQLQSEKREKVCFSNLSFLKGCQHCIGGIYCLFWWLSQNCKFNYDLSTFLAFLSQKSRLSGWVPLRIFRLQATAVDRYLPALQVYIKGQEALGTFVLCWSSFNQFVVHLGRAVEKI